MAAKTRTEPKKSGASSRSVRRNKKKTKKSLTLTSYVVMGCLLAFGVMSGLLFQHSAIAEVNNEIRGLKTELEAVQKTNDSKEGKLVTNMNLQSIESQARSFGMKEPTTEQYRYETTMENSRASSNIKSNKTQGILERLF